MVSTYHIENFGCRATQADGAALERQFEQRGLAQAPIDQANVVVLNSCSVTAAADQDARAAVRRIQRQNPSAQIVVTGCYAQRAPQEVGALAGVSCVIGNSHKNQLAEIALNQISFKPAQFIPLTSITFSKQDPDFHNASTIFVSDIFAHTELLAAPVFTEAEGRADGRTRPNLKVQDGCDNRCSFCIIPFLRGQSRSLPLRDILREANALVEQGHRELVITGINLGRWGRDLTPAQDFESLLRAILDRTSLEKLRISSVEPMDWSDDVIDLVAASPRIAKHVHVPLQSGSDAVLRRMHRKYRPWHYREKIEKIHAAMPTAAIGADVMTGFPGETAAEFEDTRRLIAELPFTYLHVFTYSARPGTPAAELPNQVPVNVARERNKILRDLAEQKKHAFMRSFVGKRVDAITLSLMHHDAEGEFTEALTDNYLKLHLQGRHEPNQWLRVQVVGEENAALIGAAGCFVTE